MSNNKEVSKQEKIKVLRYAEFVGLFVLSIFVNFKLATGLLICSPFIVWAIWKGGKK